MATNDIEKTVEQTIMNEGGKPDENKEEVKRSLSKLIEEMSSTERLALFSDLNDEEIKHLSVLETMDDDLMEEFSQRFKANRISKGRSGRSELIQMAEPFADAINPSEGRIERIKDMMSL